MAPKTFEANDPKWMCWNFFHQSAIETNLFQTCDQLEPQSIGMLMHNFAQISVSVTVQLNENLECSFD